MRRTSNIIRDGYTRSGSIPPVPGQHDGLDFEYRPMLPEELDLITKLRDDRDVPALHQAIREAVADHLHSWSEWDEQRSCSAEITPEAVGQLPPVLFWDVYAVIAYQPQGELADDAKNSKAG